MNYWEIKDDVGQLKREQRYEEALNLLFRSVHHHESSGRLYSWPYEQLAIIYRKLKQYDSEVEILERYVGQDMSATISPPEIAKRIPKAYLLAGHAKQIGDDVIHIQDNKPIQNRSILMRRVLLVDVETTGLSSKDEVIELAAILLNYSFLSGYIFEIEDTYVGLRQPTTRIPAEATKIHGIRDKDVRGKRLDDVKVKSMIDAANVLVAHNASFDRRFMVKLYPECATRPWLCSMNGIDWKRKGNHSKSLENLVKTYKLDNSQSHRGFDDVMATYRLLCHKDPDNNQPFSVELFSSDFLKPMATIHSVTRSESKQVGNNQNKGVFARLFGKS